MMSDLWHSLLATFSQLIDKSEEDEFIKQSIEGIKLSVQICGILNLDIPKFAFIQGLSSFTNLSNSKEIKPNNLICINSLIELTKNHYEYLKGCWKILLDFYSKLDYYYSLGNMPYNKSEEFYTELRNTKQNSMNIDKEILIEKGKVELLKQKQSSLDKAETLENNLNQNFINIKNNIDLIYTQTIFLNNDSFIDFIESLCEIAFIELRNKEYHHVFSYKKLVEVTENNINGRTSKTTNKIWEIVAQFLITLSVNENEIYISEYSSESIEALSQLALNYLNNDISSANFENEIIYPFYDIYKRITSFI